MVQHRAQLGQRGVDPVSLVQKIRTIWREDNLLRRVVKNSGYLFSSNTVSAALSMVQGILVARLLGMGGLGIFTIITVFASNVNRLLSFRMSEVTVRHFNTALADGKKDQAAAIAKGIGLIEAATSIAAYLILAILTPWAARTITKDATVIPLYYFYGLVLVSYIVFETSTGILQAYKRFDRVAVINLIQSVITCTLILAAFIFKRGLTEVLAAYFIGKTFAGISVIVLASHELNLNLGRGWWRTPLRTYTGWRGLFGFAINTNLNGTINLFVRDNIPLYIAGLLSTTEVGYLNIAQKLVLPITMILDPFIWPTYAEITQTIAQRQWEITRRLLRRVSTIAAGVVTGLGGVLILLGWWLIPLLYGSDARPAYPVLIVLLIGYGVASVIQWNRPLLLALGKPGFPLVVSALVGVIELALIFWVAPPYGYLVVIAVFSAYLVVSTSLIAWRGLTILHCQQTREVDQ
jgi:O-antigen/teichoic acid export membrane protein